MSILADDLAAIFTDTALSVPVILAGTTTRGFLHFADIPVADPVSGFILSSQLTVTIRAGALPGLVADNTLTVDGTSYRAREIRHKSHGKLLEVVLV